MAQLSRETVKRALADAGDIGGGSIDPADLERIKEVYAEKDPGLFATKRARLLEELTGRADSASARLAAELSAFGLDADAANRFLQGDKLSSEARVEIDSALQAAKGEAKRDAHQAARALKAGPKAGRAPRAERISV